MRSFVNKAVLVLALVPALVFATGPGDLDILASGDLNVLASGDVGIGPQGVSRISNLVRQWKMNDNAASTGVVESVSASNGVSFRNTSLMTTGGVVNTALTFTNTLYDFVDCGNNAVFSSPNISIAFWIKVASFSSGNMQIMSKDTGSINREYYVDFLVQSGQQMMRFENDGDAWAIFSKGRFVAGQWYHVVVTHASDGSMSLYTNGVADNLVADYKKGTLTNRGTPFQIGRRGTQANIYFNGILDDVRFYTKVLSLSEAQSLYNGGNGSEDL